MKAISLWQPWASMMAVGAKKNETRGWPTSYRGDLVICAAQHWDKDCDWCLWRPEVQSALKPLGVASRSGKVFKSYLPFGAALCVVTLSEIVPADCYVFDVDAGDESAFGNYTPGRFVWVTKDLRQLRCPVNVTGRQGLFNLPEALEARIMAETGP